MLIIFLYVHIFLNCFIRNMATETKQFQYELYYRKLTNAYRVGQLPIYTDLFRIWQYLCLSILSQKFSILSPLKVMNRTKFGSRGGPTVPAISKFITKLVATGLIVDASRLERPRVMRTPENI